MLDLIMKGGWAMWAIVACSIIGLSVALERWLTLRSADIDAEALLREVSNSLDTGDIDTAMATCRKTEGPVAETILIGLHKLQFLERVGKRPEEIEEGIVEAMEDHGSFVVDFLEKNLTVLATTASLGPMLGMLGTVSGMIKAFAMIRTSGAMSPEEVAGGIAEALTCTAGGLIVAVLSTVQYNYFTSRVNRFVLQVQGAATSLVEKLIDRLAKERR